MVCCALMMSSRILAGNSLGKLFNNEKIDPGKLNFCGYTCPADCKFYIASVENDETGKKEAFKIWKIKERFGVDFDPDTSVCWKCKDMLKPEGVVIQNCTVRACAIEKGYEACIECDKLTTCDKDLWKRFPDFFNAVIEMQIKYKQQSASF
ncbi:MAG TPA: hypothetical protein DCQ24_00640 [Bacteroidales bacterium]|nr:hypothetical protein [Bacteroidales bacterium]